MNYMYIDLPTSWKQIGLITSGWVWSAKPWGFPGCWNLFLSETCQLRSKWRTENTETSKWNTTCLILNGRLVVKVLLATKHRPCMVCSVFQIFPIGLVVVPFDAFIWRIICISKNNPYISKTTCFCRNVPSFDVDFLVLASGIPMKTDPNLVPCSLTHRPSTWWSHFIGKPQQKVIQFV